MSAADVLYAILDGGKHAGLYDSRPVDMAVGESPSLLPIVITCARREHAEAIVALCAELSKFSSRDAHAIAYAVQESALDIPKTYNNPIYAIRKGKFETGIWVGFKWDRIQRYVADRKASVYTGQFDDIKDAIIYMLDKPGYNFPLRSGKTIPPPKTTLPSPREAASASGSGPEGGRAAPLMAAAVVKHEDPSAGAGLTGSDSDDSFATAHGDAAEDLADGVGALTLAASIPDDDAVAIQVLGQLLARPPTMAHAAQSSTFRFPVTFGETADTFLALKIPTASELWTVLQPQTLISNIAQAMTGFSNVDQLLKKLARPAQKVGKTRVKFPWRRRTSSKRGIKLTEAERHELKEKREAKRVNLDDALKAAREDMFKHAEAMSEQFGGVHKPEYYYSLIMQKSNLKVREQGFSRWNVFVSRETRQHNDELGAGAGKRVSSAFIKELSARWRAMSEEEKDAATADGIEELEERRKNRKEGTQNVLIKSFHDARATLGSVQRELEFLAGRTGLRIVTMAVRPTSDAFNAPFVFYSDERIAYYFETLTKMPMQELVIALEGFCISGIKGKCMTQNHRTQLGDWKKKVKEFILEKLDAASTRGHIGKMYYVNFDQHITVKFGVILENWPLTKFAAPGSFSSIPILSLLYNAFDSGATRFRSLTDEEWLAWLQAYKAGEQPPAVIASPSLVNVEEDPAEVAVSQTNSSAAAEAESASVSIPPVSVSISAVDVAPSSLASNSTIDPAPMGVGIGAAASSDSAPRADVNMAETGARGQKRPIQQVGDITTGVFVNNFASMDGTGIVQVTKKPRKLRSDAGKKRGPWKKNTAAAMTALTPATTALTPATTALTPATTALTPMTTALTPAPASTPAMTTITPTPMSVTFNLVPMPAAFTPAPATIASAPAPPTVVPALAPVTFAPALTTLVPTSAPNAPASAAPAQSAAA